MKKLTVLTVLIGLIAGSLFAATLPPIRATNWVWKTNWVTAFSNVVNVLNIRNESNVLNLTISNVVNVVNVTNVTTAQTNSPPVVVTNPPPPVIVVTNPPATNAAPSPLGVVMVKGLGDKVTSQIPMVDLGTNGFSVEGMVFVNKLLAYSHDNANMLTLTRAWNAQIGWKQAMWEPAPSLAGSKSYPLNVATGSWQHIRMTLSRTNVTAAVNGVTVVNAPSSDLLNWNPSGTATLEVGNFDGWFGDIVVKKLP